MNKTNFLIDASVFVAFLVAMEPRFGGVAVHEWLSIALAAAILVHLLLHWKWIVSVGGRFFRNMWQNSRLRFGVDALLFAAFVGVMTSGLMISRVALPALGLQVQPGMSWRALHSLTADASILLLGVHFALSWSWIWGMLKRFGRAIAGLFSKPAPAQAVSVDVQES
jgi:hypothetical protein